MPAIAHDSDANLGGVLAPQARRFIHPGLPEAPRILDVTARGTREFRLTLAPGQCVGAVLRTWFDAQGVHAGCARIPGGNLRRLDYHVVVRAGAGERPYVYGPPIVRDTPLVLLGATLTLGRDAQGQALLHCHGGFVGANGLPEGGHLVLDSAIVGAGDLVVQASLFDGVTQQVQLDRETRYTLLTPAPLADAAAADPAGGAAWPTHMH